MAIRKFWRTYRLPLIVACAALMAWVMFARHVTNPGHAVSKSEAEAFEGISIPASAKNIRIAGFTQWIAQEQFLRFEAPVATCLQTAAVVVPGQRLVDIEPGVELFPKTGIRPMEEDVLADFSWFDLSKAANVVTIGGGPSEPQVWVDQDRGVFYFRKTD